MDYCRYEITTELTKVQESERLMSNDSPSPKIHKLQIDVTDSQHEFLRLLLANNDIQPSHVVRALIFLMQTDMQLAKRVVGEIYKEYNSYNAKMRLKSLNTATENIDETDVENTEML